MRQHYIFAVGTFFVGAAIGVLTVLSSSPIVAVLIPLLFGLIAGASGFYLAREDISQKAGRDRLAFVGACVTSLCLGLMLMGAITFLARANAGPKTLQEMIGTDTSLSYQEQTLAFEARAVAEILGADLREQSEIASVAIMESRIGHKATSDNEAFRAIEEDLIETIAQIAELDQIIVSAEQEEDSYVEAFNLALGYTQALTTLHEGSDVETMLWQQYLSRMLELVESIVGSDNSFNCGIFHRISDEHPSALSIMVELRSSGAMWQRSIIGQSSQRAFRPEILPQSRAELIRLLLGRNDEITANPWGRFPTLAQNGRGPG